MQAVRAHVTLVAEAGDHLLGIGEYHAVPGGEEAEVAFAVADLHQHEGIAHGAAGGPGTDRPLGRVPPAGRLDDAGELADATRVPHRRPGRLASGSPTASSMSSST